MRRIAHIIMQAIPAAALIATSTAATAHYKNEKRPQSYADAIIPMTAQEWRSEPEFRHSPGNVRAENMREIFNGNVLVVNQGRQYARDGSTHNIIKVIYFGQDGRYIWCTWNDPPGKYNLWENVWAPIKYKHDGMLWHRLDPAIDVGKSNHGNGLLYDGTTGQIVWYKRKRSDKRFWVTHDIGHLQERLPRAVWTLCPDFPSAEELGVEVNEAQTAITYDKLIAQDPGRRILRPDLITPDPTEVIK